MQELFIMPAEATETPVADKDSLDKTFPILCSEPWLERTKEAANRLGMSAGAYIRMCVTQWMNHTNEPPAKPKKPKKPN